MRTLEIKRQLLRNFEAATGAGVSFVELLKGTEQGHFALSDGEHPNLIYWHGMSEEVVTAFHELMFGYTFELTNCAPMVYWVDGCIPQMPIATADKNYKKPHWIPMEINKGPGYAVVRDALLNGNDGKKRSGTK